jgi:4-amino-4-deoxy-L-arabinose transferase-like glycosyltransferase
MRASSIATQNSQKSEIRRGAQLPVVSIFGSERRRKSYPTDLTDAQWQKILPLLRPPKPGVPPRSTNLRKMINAILHVVGGGCTWRLLPYDFPRSETVYYYFRRWCFDGTWQKILDMLGSNEYDAAGGEELESENGIPEALTLLHVSFDDAAGGEELESENGAHVLYRLPNFSVLTVSDPNYQQKPPRTRRPMRRSVLPKKPRRRLRRMADKLQQQETPIVEVKGYPQEVSLPAIPAVETAAKVALPTTPAKTSVFAVPIWLETPIVLVGLIVSFVAHAYNMFNYPHYELDEGTYMSSAWAIMNGMITPYPYGYGHPPLAWIQIAGWIQLTGGFFTFGNAINSGRVLMLLFAVGCSLLVYLIARQISTSRSAGLLAMVLFSLSPISLTYQRQVFLDNVGTFWLLLSLYLIIASKSRLSYIVSAALSFGIALLSKEIFLLFMPVLICTVWLRSTRYQRKFTVIAFTYIVVACGLAFVLLAVLKGELFPYSWHLPWDHHPHLSMLDTFIQQAQRGQVQGKFSDAWYQWTHTDRLLMEVGLIAVAFNLLVGVWENKHLLLLLPPFRFFKRWRVRNAVPVWDRRLLLALLAISFWLLLVRGGVVLTFYIIPMIPLLALNIAAAISLIVTLIVRFKLVCALLIFAMIGVLVPYDLQHAQPAFTLHPTSAQRGAMVWVRNHVPSSAMIVINSYLYMDLRESGGQGVGGGAVYPYAHVYWNVAYDPELYNLLLQGNWDRIDYIVADSEMLHDIKTTGGPMKLIYTALQHSILRAEFRADDSDGQIVISIYQVIHSNPPPEA